MLPKAARLRRSVLIYMSSLPLLSHLIDAPHRAAAFFWTASVWRVDAVLDSRGRRLLVYRRKNLYALDTSPVLEERPRVTFMVRAALFALVIGSAGSSAVPLPAPEKINSI